MMTGGHGSDGSDHEFTKQTASLTEQEALLRLQLRQWITMVDKFRRLTAELESAIASGDVDPSLFEAVIDHDLMVEGAERALKLTLTKFFFEADLANPDQRYLQPEL